MKLSRISALLFLAFYIILFSGVNCSHDDEHDHSEDEQQTEVSHEEDELEPAAQTADTHEDEAVDAQHEGGDAVTLDAKTRELIGLKTVEVLVTDIDESFPVPGKIISNEDSEVHVSTLIPARVGELMAKWGDTVRKGQPLVCIESIDLGRRRADHEKARAVLELAETEYNRYMRLYEQQAVSQRQMLEAEAKKREAEINVEYTMKMLRLTGLSEADIISPPEEHQVIGGCSVHLVSPIDGEIIERNVIKGEQVEPGDCLFRILDISSVWIEADIFEKDISRIVKGGRIKIRVPAYPDRVFTGKIFYIGGILDEKTRTVKVRSEVENREKLLKPGMYASIDIVTGEKTNVTAVPEAAIMSEDNQYYVFVQEGDSFHRHPVTIGSRGGGLAEVLTGVHPGDHVVVQGNYQLKSRMLMEKVDEHAGHIH
ncbi:efflux RND transporter periplasmic adaptor subunit [candidate division KSB1 bacterium]